MASIAKDKDGNVRIQFMANGKRCNVGLGRVSDAAAETVKEHVEVLNAALIKGRVAEKSTREWAERQPDDLHQRLAKAGLVESRKPQAPTPPVAAKVPTLAAFIKSFFDTHAFKKRNTEKTFTQTQRVLVNYFGDVKRI